MYGVIKRILPSFAEQEVNEELEQKGYSPHHFIRLKRRGGMPIPLTTHIPRYCPRLRNASKCLANMFYEAYAYALRVEFFTYSAVPSLPEV
nr:unnamed protein product [Callosobruchus chinensis]